MRRFTGDSELKTLLRRPLTVILLGLTLGPIGYLITGSDIWYGWTACLSAATVLAVCVQAPWYTLITFLPLVILYFRSFDTGTHGDKIMLRTFCLWMWSVYPWYAPAT